MARRTRNFDGCWTCRSRKVKCDLTRPYCARCAKLGITCEGYGIKLYWADSWLLSTDNTMVPMKTDLPRLDVFKRRNVELMVFSPQMSYGTHAELRDRIQEFDDLTAHPIARACYSLGPFHCFRLAARDSDGRNLHASKPSPQLISITLWRQVIANTLAIDADESYSFMADAWVHPDLLDYAKLTIVAIKGFDYRLDEQNMLHILYPKFFPNIDLDDWVENIRIVSLLYARTCSSTVEETLLLLSLRRLLLSRIFSFVRVRCCSEFFDDLVVPYLDQILDDNVQCEMRLLDSGDRVDPYLTNPVASIKTALVYGTLGLCAFHMSRVAAPGELTPPQLLKKSIELRKLCINILNRHLDDYDDTWDTGFALLAGDLRHTYNELVLLTLYIMVELDTQFSVYENFNLVFSMADYIIRNKLLRETGSRIMDGLVVIFSVIGVFYESTQLINSFDYKMEAAEESRYAMEVDQDYLQTKSANALVRSQTLEIPRSNNPTHAQPHGLQSPNPKHTSHGNLDAIESGDSDADATQSKTSRVKRLSSTRFPPSSSHVAEVSRNLRSRIDEKNIYLMVGGLPKLLIDIFQELVSLTNHVNVFRQRGSFPRTFLRICGDLERRLVDWSPEGSEWEYDKELALHQCLHVYSQAFQHALIVYFNQLVRTQSALERYQHHITRCLDLIDVVVDIMQQDSSIEMQMSYWVLLVCGSNALGRTLQKRIERMWQEVGVWTQQANFWRMKQILYEIWKRRQLNENIGFMDLVREWEVQLCLA